MLDIDYHNNTSKENREEFVYLQIRLFQGENDN